MFRLALGAKLNSLLQHAQLVVIACFAERYLPPHSMEQVITRSCVDRLVRKSLLQTAHDFHTLVMFLVYIVYNPIGRVGRRISFNACAAASRAACTGFLVNADKSNFFIGFGL